MKKIMYTALALALAVLAASCRNGDGGAAITVVIGSEPSTIDPALNNTADAATYIAHLFEGLYKFVDNGQGFAAPAPGLAESAPQKTVNADGTVVYAYTLRDGLKWSDGKPLVAADIVYAWQRLVSPETAAEYSYIIDMVQNAEEIAAGEMDSGELGIRAIGDTTLEITLTYDCPFFTEITCFPTTFPVRRDIIESAGESWTFSPATYISNGPYKMKEWVHNSHITVEKNPAYYEPVNGPDTIRFALMDNDNSMLAGFRNGEIDFIQNVPVDEIEGLLESGDIKTGPLLALGYVSFNLKRPPFDDRRVRQAFSLAVDRNYIVNRITRAGQRPAGGLVPYGIEDGTGNDFRRAGGDYYSVAAADYQKNVDEAKRLLAEAGYPDGKGFPVVEYLYNSGDANRAIAEALQDMWKTALGVNITLANQDWAVFIDTRFAGNYQIARNAWTADYSDPMTFLEIFASESGNNDSRYYDPDFDAILKQARSMSVPTERMKLMHEAEDILVGRDAALCPLYFYTMTYMLNPRITGMYYSTLGGFFFKNAVIAP